jgi:hypothetical protein
MRTRSLTIIFLIICVLDSTAQVGLRTSVGYGLKLSPHRIYDGSFVIMSDGSLILDVVEISYGQGISTNFEVNLQRERTQFILQSEYMSSAPVILRTSLGATEEYRGKMISVIPSIRLLQRARNRQIEFFETFGLHCGLITQTERFYSYTSVTTNRATRFVKSGGIPVGVNSCVGLRYNLGLGWQADFELFCRSISFSPKYGRVQLATKDGLDLLPSLTVKQSRVEYFEVLGDVKNLPDSEPDRALSEKYPFSGFGFRLGVQYQLGQKKFSR